MRIAFDAKRAFQNNTGLGNYSRMLIQSLANDYAAHSYYLMAPKPGHLFTPDMPNVQTVLPTGFYKNFLSLWRSYGVTQDLKQLSINLYHGLSNEIPAGINSSGIKSVVTIHDLIFERYPKQYGAVNTAIYRRKFRYAAQHADRVIAISKQTKQDLINYYKTPEHKIDICYQSCNPIFEKQASLDELSRIKQKYNLPDHYFLYVGSIIERKNLLTICKALKATAPSLDIPLVVIGNGGSYMETVKSYIAQHGLGNRVIFLSEQATKNDTGFRSGDDFPAIYQQATAMIYPSLFEGFGLPILEALWSRVPVITSNLSCMPETGGDAAYYINPLNVEEMATAMERIATDTTLRTDMTTKGIAHAHHFTTHAHAAAVMQVYQSLF